MGRFTTSCPLNGTYFTADPRRADRKFFFILEFRSVITGATSQVCLRETPVASCSPARCRSASLGQGRSITLKKNPSKFLLVH